MKRRYLLIALSALCLMLSTQASAALWDRENPEPQDVPTTPISLNSPFNINITGDKTVEGRSFTPGVSGIYIVESSGDCDSFVYLYDSEYNLLGKYDDGKYGNFCLQSNLEAGKTYYYCFTSYDDPASYSVTLSKAEDVNGFIFGYDDEELTATVLTYVGDMSALTIPAEVEHNGKTYAIRDIAYGAFADASITSLTIEADLGNVDADVFSGMDELESIEMDVGVNRTEGGVLYNVPNEALAFYPPSKPDPRFVVPKYACEIWDNALTGAKYLEEIVIHSDVYRIDYYAFEGCPALQSITVDSGNSRYYSADGVLIGNYEGNLLCYPQAKAETSFTIPDSVVDIEYRAFRNVVALEELILTQHITEIGYDAFDGSPNITFKAPLNSYAYLWLTDRANTGFKVEPMLPDVSKQLTAESPFTAKTEWNSVLRVENAESGLYRIACRSDHYPHLYIFSNTYIGHYSQSGGADGYAYNLNVQAGATYFIITSFDKHNFAPGVEYTVTIEPLITSGDFTYSRVEGGVRIDRYSGSAEHVVIPETLPVAGGEYPVIEIASGYDIFTNKSSIKSISLPSGLAVIGAYAFLGCENLDNVTLPASLTALGRSAFGRTGITSLTIPSGLTKFDYAFYGCEKLKSVTLEYGVKSIGYGAFEECDALTNVTIPESVENIGGGAFWGCNKLTNVTIPASVDRIGSGAFSNCSSLSSVVISEGVKSIMGGAFYSCDSLRSLLIPWSVEEITWGDDERPFDSDIVLEVYDKSYALEWATDNGYSVKDGNLIVLPVDSYESEGFEYIIKDGAAVIVGYKGGATEVSVPRVIEHDGHNYTVVSIYAHAFRECDIRAVTFPDTVARIGRMAFVPCENLKSAVIPNSVVSIGDEAFSLYDVSFTIYGFDENGAARKWARDNNAAYIPHSDALGDVNLDRVRNDDDVIAVLEHILDIKALTDEYALIRANAYEDNAVNNRDAVKIFMMGRED